MIVVNGSGGDVSIGNTLADALSEATGGTIGEPGGNGNPPPPDGGGDGTTDQQVQALLTQALEHFAKAQEALKAGDLALYQQELEQAQSLIEQANQLVAGQANGGSTPPADRDPDTVGQRHRVAQCLTLRRRSGTQDRRRCPSRPSGPSAGARSSPSSSPATA